MVIGDKDDVLGANETRAAMTELLSLEGVKIRSDSPGRSQEVVSLVRGELIRQRLANRYKFGSPTYDAKHGLWWIWLR